MVERQIAARGIRDARVLEAMRTVPRERFVSPALAEFAYRDSPLPIEEGQTISQPYIVAAMIDALELAPSDRVLEIGTGSGYAAAVLARLAREVYTVERLGPLATLAACRLAEAGYDNVQVRHGDGTLGWPEAAPFDAIAVAASAPQLPDALLAQLAIGGRLVIPVGETLQSQRLMRVIRAAADRYETEDLGAVAFVPLIGAGGWPSRHWRRAPAGPAPRALAQLIGEAAEPIADLDAAALAPLCARMADARVVLLGAATHGSSEHYRMRARITEELVLRHGFRAVAIEGDWPDAARVDDYVRHRADEDEAARAFARFPAWMWRNRETRAFTEWLRAYNRGREPAAQVSFHGLDLYSLYTSSAAVIAYLARIDRQAAEVARQRYGCLTPWQRDPAAYGRAALTGGFARCEAGVVGMLRDLLAQRIGYLARDGEQWFDAVQNARVVADAERYYRILFYGARESWNLRDQHMFDTLEAVRAFRGADAKIVVWAHNAHVGDGSATEMGGRGEHTIGSLCRARLGDAAYAVGFGTDHGFVAAAHDWGAPIERVRVWPAHAESYERLCHDSGVPAFSLHLRLPRRAAVRAALMAPRLERAIGVVYRPEAELENHYLQAMLPVQFDEWIWCDETDAVEPLGEAPAEGEPETYPFGL
jgi:protein-L-isoaspartate(D-aspartate) O-methyltransferase